MNECPDSRIHKKKRYEFKYSYSKIALNTKAAKQFALDKLDSELDEDLVYHSVEHTLDVVNAARLLGEMEGLVSNDILLLETAALYHDIGFTETYEDHEEHSVKIARKALPEFGYSQNDIEIIAGAINATKIPQKPKNLLEEVLADSDLDYLGREDIFVIGQRLHYEWNRQGRDMSLVEWHETQIRFLQKHRYFTQSALNLREARKQENIRELENLLYRER